MARSRKRDCIAIDTCPRSRFPFGLPPCQLRCSRVTVRMRRVCVLFSWFAMLHADHGVILREQKFVAGDNDSLPAMQWWLRTDWQTAVIPINHICRPGAAVPRAHGCFYQAGRALLQI